MSELKNKIEADYMQALRNKNAVAKNLLSVIRGEIQSAEKQPGAPADLPDGDVLRILTKLAKSIRDTQAVQPSAQSAEELFIVESYLPKQMTEQEIADAISAIPGEPNIAEVMRAFANLPADRKTVSAVYHRIKNNKN